MTTDRNNIAILFDLDGVVFNTEKYYTVFWAEEGRKYCPQIKDFAQIIKGHGIQDILSEYFPDDRLLHEKILDELHEMEKGMVFPFIDGVEDFIREVHRENIKICLVTSSAKSKMEHVFRARPVIKEYFPLMVTASDIKHAKPSPECYLMGAEKCGVRPQDCIVFEDSFAGISSARNAGMKVIGLATTNPREALEGKVDRIIDDFSGFTIEDALSVL